MKKMTANGEARHKQYVTERMTKALGVVALPSMTKLILIETVTAEALAAGARNPELCPCCGAAEDDEETCPHCIWGVSSADAVRALDNMSHMKEEKA